MPSTWPCPSCHRLVPESVPACRCGYPKPSVRVPGPQEKTTRDLLNSWEFVGLVTGLLLACAYAIFALFRTVPQERLPPIFGYRQKGVFGRASPTPLAP